MSRRILAATLATLATSAVPSTALAQSFDAVYGFPGVFETLQRPAVRVQFDLQPMGTWSNSEGMWGDWSDATGTHQLWFIDQASATTPAPNTPPGAATWEGSFDANGAVCDGIITTAEGLPGVWKTANCPLSVDIDVRTNAQGDRGVHAFIADNLVPGTPVWLVMGNATPGGTVSRCPDLSLDLGSPRVFDRAIADGNGQVVLQRKIPAAVAGRTVQVQAVDILACSATPVQSLAL